MQKITFRILLACMVILCTISCATRAIKTSGDQIPVATSEDYRSFFLLGNMGANYMDDLSTMDLMVDKIKQTATDNDYVLVLGDNVSAGSLNKDDKDSKDLNQYREQLERIATIPSNILVLPGDHDWNDEGIDGLKKIEKLTEEILDNDEAFQPENACPIKEVDISGSMHLIIVDSQWYIEDWNDNPKFNDECEIKTREKFLSILGDAIRKARHKTVVLAMHHPVFTNGVHGGELGLRMITSPLQENGYVPVAGFAYSFIRSQAGLYPQDRYNPLMNSLMEEIKVMSTDVDRMILVSAHEESLQYIDHGNIKQLISGAVSSTNMASLGKKGKFSAGKMGYTELRIYKDQSSQVLFHVIDKNEDLVQVYDNKLFEPKVAYDLSSIAPNPNAFEQASIYPREETDVDDKHERFYGAHYRKLYGTAVNAPVVMLDTLYGGLKVERAGGGNQTQGLRLVDSLDREYNMRALEKDALQFLKSAGYDKLDADKYFAETLPQQLIRDFYTSSHPYGAFAIPRLAGAIDLNHTHPRLYYVPKQETLGDFNETHGDRLYMIVEKPDDSFKDAHMFGYHEDVESTDDLFEKLREDEKYVVDEDLYIRARIFDMLLGDWDRHEDQWRWAEVKDGDDKSRFVAIPRDRDQVFARFDGKLIEFLNKTIGVTRQFGNYGPDIEYIKQFSQSAINLDRALLQRTTLEDWKKQVAFIQSRITPSIVEKAFKEMPIEVRDSLWRQTQQDLLARKSNLNGIVDRYYTDFIKFQTLKGTDKDDRFEIKRKDGSTVISGYRIKDGKSEDVLFQRTFEDDATDEVWIYGLDDDDEFIVEGDGTSKIKIVVAGGKGKDRYVVHNGQSLSIYDYDSEKNDFKEAGKAKIVSRDDYEINHYDTEKEPKKKSKFSLSMGYNPDDGFHPQIGIEKSTIGFERNPYSLKYGIHVDYRSLTQAAVFEGYVAKANVLGHWNMRIDLGTTTNNYTENFFGYGNDTSFDQDTSYDTNRVNLQRQWGGASIYKKGAYGSDFIFGINYRGVEVDPNTLAYTNIDKERDDYIDGYFNYKFESVDDSRFTTRGMLLHSDFMYTNNLANGSNFISIDPRLNFWNALNSNRSIVLKTSVAGQMRIGDDPVFYQAARLGADRGLRSYRQDRFAGNYALNASADLRFDVPPIKTRLLPLQVIPFAGVDTGRVWVVRDGSNEFHTSYGGGLDIAFPGLIQGTFQYFTGEEGGRFSFGISLAK